MTANDCCAVQDVPTTLSMTDSESTAKTCMHNNSDPTQKTQVNATFERSESAVSESESNSQKSTQLDEESAPPQDDVLTNPDDEESASPKENALTNPNNEKSTSHKFEASSSSKQEPHSADEMQHSTCNSTTETTTNSEPKPSQPNGDSADSSTGSTESSVVPITTSPPKRAPDVPEDSVKKHKSAEGAH